MCSMTSAVRRQLLTEVLNGKRDYALLTQAIKDHREHKDAEGKQIDKALRRQQRKAKQTVQLAKRTRQQFEKMVSVVV